MPNPTYTPAQLADEVQTLAENFRSALHQFADISDAIDYCNEGTSEYRSKVQDLEDEIAEDNGYFEAISEAVQSKTGQTEPYEKDELASTIDGLVAAQLDTNSLTPLEIGINENGFYLTNISGTGNPVFLGMNEQGHLYVKGVSNT